MNQDRWNRLLLTSFWCVLVLSVIIECLFLQTSTMPTKRFVNVNIIQPTAIMVIIIILAECGVRFMRKHHDYVLISAATLMTVTIASIHSSLEYLLFFLFFPIMISIFYFQYKKLFYAIMNTGIAFSALYLFDPDIHQHTPVAGALAMAGILFVYSGIAFGVLARGREAFVNLKTSYESNQELLVRTILMDKLAKTDALTETYNHMAYHEYKDYLVEQADSGRLILHLAILDIDNFKKVNDTYGHKAGDEVLQKVASIARSKTGSNDFVARYGGEEFVILFTEKNFQEVFSIVEDIRASIASTHHEALNGLNVTVSIGLNPYSPGMGKEELFLRADAALYEAKHSGKNRTVVASATLSEV